jgi:hypothetical protein
MIGNLAYSGRDVLRGDDRVWPQVDRVNRLMEELELLGGKIILRFEEIKVRALRGERDRGFTRLT